MRKGFVIHHNGPPANCVGEPHTRCERFWAAVKSFHVNDKGWSDIAYSFGVCPHGTRFIGRGWDKAQFANGADVVGPDDGADRYWYTVLVFLGTGEEPSDEMVEGVKELIDTGRAWARCGDRVLPHNAFKVKACPGPEFTAYAKAWDNRPLDPPEPDLPPNAVPEEPPMFVAFVQQTKRYYSSNAGIVAALTKEEAEDLTDAIGGFRMHVFPTNALWNKVHGKS